MFNGIARSTFHAAPERPEDRIGRKQLIEEYRKIVCFLDRQPAFGEHPFQEFLNSLLAMEANLIGQKWPRFE
jgi:hypothetical protein